MIAARINPLLAEIVPGVEPTWHILRCHPGHENIADAHLSGRRFGVYVPLEDKWISNKREDRVDKQLPLFPGYLFVFVWGLAQHLARIRAVTGVQDFLRDADGAPILVPDCVITQVREIEWNSYLNRLPRTLFRPRRGQQITVRRWHTPNHGFRDPIPEKRVEALHKALGLSGA